MNIYTLTLNPAYDVHAFAQELALRHENLAKIQSREAGGKGVNISRALCSGQTPNTAIIVLGKENSGDFTQSLAQSGIDCIYLEKEGRIRENLTLHCGDGTETRISFDGFAVDESVLTEVLANMELTQDSIVTFTGRVPAGIPLEKAKDFLKLLQRKGVRIVLDSKSFSIEDILEIQPWLIKPNQEEISEYLGAEIKTPEQALEKAAIFASRGVTNTMVSLGEKGAVLLSDGKAYMATCPPVEAISTIGAGDSTIAGFVAAAYAGGDAEQCLKTAVSYGTAACLTAGTLPPRKEDQQKIYGQVTVKEVV